MVDWSDSSFGGVVKVALTAGSGVILGLIGLVGTRARSAPVPVTTTPEFNSQVDRLVGVMTKMGVITGHLESLANADKRIEQRIDRMDDHLIGMGQRVAAIETRLLDMQTTSQDTNDTAHDTRHKAGNILASLPSLPKATADQVAEKAAEVFRNATEGE